MKDRILREESRPARLREREAVGRRVLEDGAVLIAAPPARRQRAARLGPCRAAAEHPFHLVGKREPHRRYGRHRLGRGLGSIIRRGLRVFVRRSGVFGGWRRGRRRGRLPSCLPGLQRVAAADGGRAELLQRLHPDHALQRGRRVLLERLVKLGVGRKHRPHRAALLLLLLLLRAAGLAVGSGLG